MLARLMNVSPETLAPYDQPGLSNNRCRPALPFNGAFGASEYADALDAVGSRPAEPLAIYIHIPFCPVRCLYCACNTTITHNSEKIDRYLDALENEVDLVATHVGRNRKVAQLHIGGGTPNYLDDSQLARLYEIVERRFKIDADTRTSIECNPRRASAGQFELLQGLGFRQISLGVQDLEPNVQRAIGRIQSSDLVHDVYWTAREAGFECINLDLVYGLPYQNAKGFEQTLKSIVDLAPNRVSCYSYIHLPDTRPHQHAIHVDQLPNAIEKLRLFRSAVQAFTQSGYNWIGLDCFARENDELSIAQAAGRLNRNCIGYTAVPTQHLIAFGMSGIGEVDGAFVQNDTRLKRWSELVLAGELPIAWGHRPSEADRRRRDAILHLMCNLELPASFAPGLEEEYERLCTAAGQGIVEVTPHAVRITPHGRYFLRSLWSDHDIPPEIACSRWHQAVTI